MMRLADYRQPHPKGPVLSMVFFFSWRPRLLQTTLLQVRVAMALSTGFSSNDEDRMGVFPE